MDERLAQSLDEHRSVAQAGQRIAEAGAADALLRNRALTPDSMEKVAPKKLQQSVAMTVMDRWTVDDLLARERIPERLG